MNGQPSPNQGGIAQLAGGMGGNPTLGGAPQTPPMPQGGAQKPPQQAPQGGLPPDLLKALAAAKVKKMQDAAKRELELQMAQQQAASGEGNKTVVQQLQEGVEKDTAQEMMQALSGGIKQAGQMSAQAQGQPQPMSGGIAAAPGANQAAQPEAMAAGGIVAFKKGGTEGEEEEEEPVDAYNRASNETWLGQGIRRGKAAVKDVAGLLSLRPWSTDPERVSKGDTRTNAEVEGYTPEGYKVNDRADQLKAAFDRQQAARPVSDERSATTPFDPMNPWAKVGTTPAATLQGKPGNMDDPALVRREDMRRGIANVQRPPAPAIQQTQRPAAIQQPSLNSQTNPNYVPPAAAGDAGGLSGLMAEQLKNRIGAKPEDAEAAALKKYNEAMAVDPELAKQLAADTARVRATAERKGAAPTWQESLYAAMPKGRPQPGSSIFTTIGDAVSGINALELQRKNEKETAEKELLGMSKAGYDTQRKEQGERLAYGTAANKTALESLDKAMTNATHLLNTQSVAEAARQQNVSTEKIAANRLKSEERIAAIREKAIKDSRVIPLAEQMNAELIKADTEEKRNAIVARYSQITDALKPSQAAIRGEDKLIQMAFEAWLGSKAGRDATPAQIRDKMKELRETDGGIPSTPPAGAVRKVP